MFANAQGYSPVLAPSQLAAMGALGAMQVPWQIVWTRPDLTPFWWYAGWFAGVDHVGPRGVSCAWLRWMVPGAVGNPSAGSCGKEPYTELPFRNTEPLASARYYPIFDRYAANEPWQFHGWLWTNERWASSMRALDPTRFYVGS